MNENDELLQRVPEDMRKSICNWIQNQDCEAVQKWFKTLDGKPETQFTALTAIAITRCTRSFKVADFVPTALASRLQDMALSEEDCRHDSQDRWKGWLLISLVFGREDVFKKASGCLVFEYHGGLESLQQQAGWLLPRRLADEIISARRAALEATYTEIHEKWVSLLTSNLGGGPNPGMSCIGEKIKTGFLRGQRLVLDIEKAKLQSDKWESRPADLLDELDQIVGAQDRPATSPTPNGTSSPPLNHPHSLPSTTTQTPYRDAPFHMKSAMPTYSAISKAIREGFKKMTARRRPEPPRPSAKELKEICDDLLKWTRDRRSADNSSLRWLEHDFANVQALHLPDAKPQT
ncbi:MAG: hypothetical protein M1839_005666 [Geoglossum umbratile]|nr:MAG: hypothetical protein M1839_005666 [Geoglossum umbratile]